MAKSKCLGIIPVRLESTRLPNKPLKDILGKSLVQRVWEQAKRCNNVDRLAIATNSHQIESECTKIGAEVILTGSHHETGTDRVAEAASILEKQGHVFDLVANIQGDMPFINPVVIDSTIENLGQADSSFGMSTIATPFTILEEFERPSCVKVAIGKDSLALYFSRSPIPFWRDRPDPKEISEENPYGYKHMGLYVYRATVLKNLSQLSRVTIEQREGLEQLRALANGIKISVNIVPNSAIEPSIEVDTPLDLDRAIQYAQSIKE